MSKDRQFIEPVVTVGASFEITPAVAKALDHTAVKQPPRAESKPPRAQSSRKRSSHAE